MFAVFIGIMFDVVTKARPLENETHRTSPRSLGVVMKHRGGF